MESHTYRMQPHTNADDDTRYRESEEVKEWEAKDPVIRMRSYLESTGALTDELSAQIAADAEERASILREGLAEEVPVSPLDMFDYVYTEPTPQLAAQRAILEAELADAEEEN